MMKVKTKVKVDMAPVQQVMKRLGVTPDGDVQMFVTNMVDHRIVRYMPFSSGVMSTKTKFIGTAPKPSGEHMADKRRIISPTEIYIPGPYAHYQYVGKKWVDPKTHAAGFLTKNGWRSRLNVPKVETDQDLTHDKTKNPQAGPYWDRALVAAEGAAMAADVQEYINKRKQK